MSDADKLRERLDEFMRESAETQAKTYHQFGGLLDRLAKQDIQSVEFAREAVDLYMGAVSKAASSGVTLLGETIMAGIKGIGAAASATASAAKAAERETAQPRGVVARPKARTAPKAGSAAPV